MPSVFKDSTKKSVSTIVSSLLALFKRLLKCITTFFHKVYIFLYPFWPFAFKHEHLTIKWGAVVNFDYASVEAYPYTIRIPEGVTAIKGGFDIHHPREEESPPVGDILRARVGDQIFFDRGQFYVNMVCPSTLVRIGSHALCNGSLFREIKLNEGLKYIDEYGFAACSARHIKFPSTVLEVGSGAFYKGGARTIKLNEGLKRIGGDAFYLASHIETLTLPQTLEEINCVESYLYPLSYDDANLHLEPGVRLYQKVRAPFLEVVNCFHVNIVLDYIIAKIRHHSIEQEQYSQYQSSIRAFSQKQRQLITNIGLICVEKALPAEVGMQIIGYCESSRDRNMAEQRERNKVKREQLREEEAWCEYHQYTYNARMSEIKAESGVARLGG